jgi:hypothetical protein
MQLWKLQQQDVLEDKYKKELAKDLENKIKDDLRKEFSYESKKNIKT